MQFFFAAVVLLAGADALRESEHQFNRSDFRDAADDGLQPKKIASVIQDVDLLFSKLDWGDLSYYTWKESDERQKKELSRVRYTIFFVCVGAFSLLGVMWTATFIYSRILWKKEMKEKDDKFEKDDEDDKDDSDDKPDEDAKEKKEQESPNPSSSQNASNT